MENLNISTIRVAARTCAGCNFCIAPADPRWISEGQHISNEAYFFRLPLRGTHAESGIRGISPQGEARFSAGVPSRRGRKECSKMRIIKIGRC